MPNISRRAFLQLSLPLVLAACAAPPAGTDAMPRVSTPAPARVCAPTLPQTEGPYYTPNTPERTSLLEAGVTGTRLVVTGQVLTADCQPVAGAWLDFWHADDAGRYDNAGYRLRGHQFADDQGRYRLETIVPGLYPGRTRHIHVKVQAPNGPVLTTQVYFPDEPANATDGIFDAALVMATQKEAAGWASQFDFILERSPG